jgi:hypothetical protein
MKKNDTMGYVAYALMLGVALIVAFVVIRPLMTSGNIATLPMNQYLYVFLLVLGGIIINALFIELGHLAGAKMGRYSIDSWICLGVGCKKQRDGKMKFAFSEFDGLAGGTVIVPKDLKKSNPRHYIYMPLVFFLLEVIASVLMIAFGIGASMLALELAGILLLTVAGMIYLYDIFPCALDSANDGYLMMILNSQSNVEAYNDLLLKQHQIAFGEKVEVRKIYDHVTDFTAGINRISFYEALGKGDYEKALEINEKTIASKGKVSSGVYEDAMAEKTGLYFLVKPFEEAKAFFIDSPLESKKHIAALGNIACVRAYVLVSGLAEESLTETEAALERAEKALSKLSKERYDIEKQILSESLKKVVAAHPDWDFGDYDYLGLLDKKEDPKKEPAPKAEEKTEGK